MSKPSRRSRRRRRIRRKRSEDFPAAGYSAGAARVERAARFLQVRILASLADCHLVPKLQLGNAGLNPAPPASDFPPQNPAGLPGGSFGFPLHHRLALSPKSRRDVRAGLSNLGQPQISPAESAAATAALTPWLGLRAPAKADVHPVTRRGGDLTLTTRDDCETLRAPIWPLPRGLGVRFLGARGVPCAGRFVGGGIGGRLKEGRHPSCASDGSL